MLELLLLLVKVVWNRGGVMGGRDGRGRGGSKFFFLAQKMGGHRRKNQHVCGAGAQSDRSFDDFDRFLLVRTRNHCVFLCGRE